MENDIIERLMNTVHERRSLFWSQSPGPNPSEILMDGVAENDACIIRSFGGAIRIGITLCYKEQRQHD